MAQELGKRSADLAPAFQRIAGLLLSEQTLQSSLDLMCRLARDLVVGTSGAGVTLVRESHYSTAAYSDELVKAADAL